MTVYAATKVIAVALFLWYNSNDANSYDNGNDNDKNNTHDDGEDEDENDDDDIENAVPECINLLISLWTSSKLHVHCQLSSARIMYNMV